MQCPKCSHEPTCSLKSHCKELYDGLKATEDGEATQCPPVFTVTVKVDCSHYSRKNKGRVVPQ